MSATHLTSVQVLLLLCAAAAYLRWRRKTSPFPLPPGPPKLPILGNLLNFPSNGFDWEVYQKWGKQYNSDILHLSVPGTSIIVLNSVKAARDLFERRSAMYSSRPKFTFIRELLGFSWLIPFMPYGPRWKEQRRYFQRHTQSSHDLASGEVGQMAAKYSRLLALNLMQTPDNYLEHINDAVCSILYSTTYGSHSVDDNTSYFKAASDVIQALSDASIPLVTLIDSAPWIARFLPRALMPASFDKGPNYWKRVHYQFRDKPFDSPQHSQHECFVSRCLSDTQSSAQDTHAQREHIKDAAAVILIGGSGTTVAVMHTFILAMLAFPQCQKKAQAELDRLIGLSRLPEPSDMDSLPYLTAVLKEVQRWKPVGPIAIPHYLESDDVYEGHFIPGQSIVIGNVWAMLHNELEYPDPASFNPERFLKDGQIDASVRDPVSIAFGFGRRICPGANIAQITSMMQMATILSCFIISPAVDPNGNIETPTMVFRSGITLQPEPFRCRITPRHGQVRHILQEMQ